MQQYSPTTATFCSVLVWQYFVQHSLMQWFSLATILANHSYVLFSTCMAIFCLALLQQYLLTTATFLYKKGLTKLSLFFKKKCLYSNICSQLLLFYITTPGVTHGKNAAVLARHRAGACVACVLHVCCSSTCSSSRRCV